jgi:hypothetical protein
MHQRKVPVFVAVVGGILGVAGGARAATSTVWNFDGNANPASGPGAISYFNGDALWTQFGTDTINGQSTGILDLAAASPTQGLVVTHNAPNNGGPAAVGINQYTVIMDVKFPQLALWNALMQTNQANAADNDADWFIYTPPDATNGGSGINGTYGGTVAPDKWYRLALSVDLTNAGLNYRTYVDGAPAASLNGGGVDGRFAIDPTFLLMADNDNETLAAKLSSFFFIDRAMSAAEVAALGGPTADGINLTALQPQWSATASGDWHDGGNWINGAPNGIDAPANFLSSITAPRTVFTDTAVTVGSIKFDNANTYVIAGAGSLTLQSTGGSSQVDVVSGSHKINLPFTIANNASLNVANAATLTLADPVTLASGITLTKNGAGTVVVLSTLNAAGPATLKINGGVVNLAAANNDPNITIKVDPATLNVGANQAVGGMALELGGNVVNVGRSAAGQNVPASLRVASLSVTGGGTANTLNLPSAANTATVAGELRVDANSKLVKQGAGLLRAGSLSIDATGTLDLTGGDMVVDTGTAGAVRGALASAYNRGRWDRAGLTSSTAAGDALHVTALGYAAAGDVSAASFDGQSVGAAALLIKYTYVGDANLDGRVNGLDIARFTLGASDWSRGDFNYDGIVNADDYALLNLGATLQGAPITPAVPEPTAAAIAVVGMALGSLRRRRLEALR